MSWFEVVYIHMYIYIISSIYIYITIIKYYYICIFTYIPSGNVTQPIIQAATSFHDLPSQAAIIPPVSSG